MRNTYITLTALLATGGLNVTGTAYDSRLLVLIENVSREIDNYCNRTFYPVLGTYVFSGDGSTSMLVPDLISVDSLKEDTNADGTFETTWSGTGTGGTDYFLEPFNARPTAEFSPSPFTKILVNTQNSNGTQDSFLKGQRNYEIVGTWGYSHLKRDVGKDASSSLDSTSTALAFISGTGLDVGNLILIDSEWMYVRSIAGTTHTVDRAVNNSTAGTHASGTNVLVVTYPGPIQEAAMIQAARIWKRRESAYSNLVGLDQTGQIAVFTGGLDGDVKALLQPYRKMAI